MWIFINSPITKELFFDSLEYLIKIETLNKIGESKTYIGIIQNININNITLKCFVLESDLSFSKNQIHYINVNEITSWYILNGCYSNLNREY